MGPRPRRGGRCPAADAAPIDTPTGCGPLEHDEDNDLIPDRCDNCRAVPNNPQGPDQDSDGVGDVSDPQVDRFSPRVRFMAFDSIPPDLALTPGGTWSIEKDLLVVGPTAASADYIATYDAKSPNVVIRTRVNLIAATPPVVGTHSFGLWAEVELASPPRAFPTGTVFELIDTGTHTAHLVETQQPNPPIVATTVADPLLFAAGRHHADPNQDAHVRDGAVGLRIHGDITVSFEYLEVFEAAPVTP